MKAHPLFQGLDWNNLLSQEPLYVPELETEEDTSYFDCANTHTHTSTNLDSCLIESLEDFYYFVNIVLMDRPFSVMPGGDFSWGKYHVCLFS